MSDIWQEHRKFIVNLMVGGLVFLIAYLVIDGIYGSDTANYRNRIRRHKRAQVNMVQASDLREIRAERKRQMNEFNRMRAIVQRIPDAGYSLEQGKQSPDLHYSRQVDLLRRDVLELCALKNIQVDQNLGLPAKFPTSRIEKDWYLRGLDVMRQVLLLALEADQLMEQRLDADGGEGHDLDPPVAGVHAAQLLGQHLIEILVADVDQEHFHGSHLLRSSTRECIRG